MSMHCGRLQLEKYVGGELDNEQFRAVQSHIHSCTDCASYVTQLKTERNEFLQKHPFSSFTRAHAPVVGLPWYRRFLGNYFRPSLIPVYTTLIVVAVALPLLYRGNDSSIRSKGKSSISFFYNLG